MFGSGMVDVAIGLAFTFLLLSLIATWLQELIATGLKWRSKHLLDAVQNLLDPAGGKLAGTQRVNAAWSAGVGASTVAKLGDNVVKALYSHPIITSLAKPDSRPSYIPAREFGVALFDLLAKAGTEASPGKQGLDALTEGINQVGNQATREALLALVDSAAATEQTLEKQIAAARASVEAWFDASMDRSTGWYKRHAQAWALVLGLGLAIVFNADAVGLGRVLWQDAALRESISGSVVAYVQQGEEIKAKDAQQQLTALNLPLGWSFQWEDTDPATPADPRDYPISARGWFLKALGLFLSGFAISQGSPFWFDTLNRLVNMRGAGKKPGGAAGG